MAALQSLLVSGFVLPDTHCCTILSHLKFILKHLAFIALHGIQFGHSPLFYVLRLCILPLCPFGLKAAKPVREREDKKECNNEGTTCECV